MNPETAVTILEQSIPGMYRQGPGHLSHQIDGDMRVDIRIDAQGGSVHFFAALGAPRAALDGALLYTLLRLNDAHRDRGHFFSLDRIALSIVLCATLHLPELLEPRKAEHMITGFAEVAREACGALGQAIAPH